MSTWNLLVGVFGDEQMMGIFSEQATVAAWLDVEAALADAEARVGLLSRPDADAIMEATRLEIIDKAELWRQTRNVGYPVLPLVRMLAAKLPAGPNGRVHYGATTQDILDSALACQLRDSLKRIDYLLVDLGDHIGGLVEAHRATVMAGRTHGQHAVPTTLGAKMAVFLSEVERHRERLGALGPRVSVVSLHGAGGTSASFGGAAREVRAEMAQLLGLGDAAVPWHVARDNLAEYAMFCALCAGSCARLAREVAELSRTEIGELGEEAGYHRGASSTMPQKANPISSEVVIGMASAAGALVSAVVPAMQATHERATGEWQIEWYLLPEIAVLASSALLHVGEIVRGLRVDSVAMAKNIADDHGLLMAEAYMMQLAEKIGRETAHDVVYDAALAARELGSSLWDALRMSAMGDERMAGVTIDEIAVYDYLGDVDATCSDALRRWQLSAR